MFLRKFRMPLLVGAVLCLTIPANMAQADQQHWFFGGYNNHRADEWLDERMSEREWRVRQRRMLNRERVERRRARHERRRARQEYRRERGHVVVFNPFEIFLPGSGQNGGRHLDPDRDFPTYDAATSYPQDRNQGSREQWIVNDPRIVEVPKPRSKPGEFQRENTATNPIDVQPLTPQPARIATRDITGSDFRTTNQLPKTAQGLTGRSTSRLLSCTKAQGIIEGFGFSEVKPAQCTGNVYSFIAHRDGKNFKLKLSALNGELTEVRRQ